jgi:hypothetical protein
MDELEMNKKEIWSKGRIVTGLDPARYRRDVLGHLMQFDKFQMNDVLGWDIEERYSSGSSDPEISPMARLRFKSLFQDTDDYIAEKRREMEKKKQAK